MTSRCFWLTFRKLTAKQTTLESKKIHLTIETDPNESDFDSRIYNDIEKIIAPLREKFTKVFQVGKSPTNKAIKESILNDQLTLVPLSVLVILTILVIVLIHNGMILIYDLVLLIFDSLL